MAAPAAADAVKRVALGVCGGIAAYKAAEVLRGLQREGCQVRVCMTRRACEFVQPLTFRALSGEHVVVDDYAPDNPDPIAHITFSQSIDLLLIAPATANTMAKFAHGIADDFLTSTYLAASAPVLIAPAMNSRMWAHPATARNLSALKADGVQFVAPEEGEMACGTTGPGRLAEPQLIVAAAMKLLMRREVDAANVAKTLAGERVVITAGATREAIDPVRFISNRSSGKMGFALAEAALARGAATVTVIAGSTTVSELSRGIKLVQVVSAEEMRTAVLSEMAGATVFIAAAAVADYRPVDLAPRKIKKTESLLTLALERTPDILGEVARAKTAELIVVGFAAETHDLLAHAREKMQRKNTDLIVANNVLQDGAGFDADTNRVTILARDTDEAVEIPLMSKLDVAKRILDAVVEVRRSKRGVYAVQP
ncbi:MAG: bifunctional phosphopantothenoylcysteine decarboxylase/phosphopantothenate--cysteine ligase CoaBC [Pyrinomonadaceae bacterium]